MDAKLNQFEVTAEELDQYPGRDLAKLAREVQPILPCLACGNERSDVCAMLGHVYPLAIRADDDATGVK